MIDGTGSVKVVATPMSSDRTADVERLAPRTGVFETALRERAADGAQVDPAEVEAASQPSLQATGVESDVPSFADTEMPLPLVAELAHAFHRSEAVDIAIADVAVSDARVEIDRGHEQLHIVLMSLLASGNLAQMLVAGGALTEHGAVPDRGKGPVEAGISTAKISNSSPVPPRVWLGQTRSTAIAVVQHFSRELDGFLSKTVAKHALYERVFANVLPPKENLIVVSANEEKRVFIRNFFAPSDALERLREFNRGLNGGLDGARLYLNGDYSGVIRT